MPRPIPPPPPQPSAEETVRAVAYLRWTALAGVLFFAAWSAVAYGPDSAMAKWGRKSSQSWMVRKAQALDEAELRAHPGQRVVWLVGSSILRESLDIAVVNASLESAQSPFRVAQFSQGRGAAGLASGMLERLPIRRDDVVVHNIAVQNYRADWLDWTGLPAERMSRLLSPDDLWQTREWSLQERVEQAVAMPWNFWRWHSETMDGLIRWGEHLVVGRVPRPMGAGVYFRFYKWERASVFKDGPPSWEVERNLLTAAVVDLSDRQFNMQGLEHLRSSCEEIGAPLVLLDIPPSAFAQWRLESAQVRSMWDAWTSAQPELVIAPQLAERDFYDRRHPNFRGRQKLSAWLVDWVEQGGRAGEAARSRPPESQVEDYPWDTPIGRGRGDSKEDGTDPG